MKVAALKDRDDLRLNFVKQYYPVRNVIKENRIVIITDYNVKNAGYRWMSRENVTSVEIRKHLINIKAKVWPKESN